MIIFRDGAGVTAQFQKISVGLCQPQTANTLAIEFLDEACSIALTSTALEIDA